MRKYYMRSKGVVRLIVFLLVLQIALGIMALESPALETRADWFVPLTLPSLPLIVVIAVYVMVPLRIAKQVEANEQLSSQTFWIADSDQVMIRNAVTETKLDWAVFSEVIEFQEYYLFLHAANRRVFNFVPKRAFESQSQEAAFRKVFEEKLGEPKETIATTWQPTMLIRGSFALLVLSTLAWLAFLAWRIAVY